MTRKKRTEITIETRRLTIIRMSGAKTDFVYCLECRAKVKSFSPSHASLIFRTNTDELERLSRNGQIHFISMDILCGNSLAAFFKWELRCVED